MSSGERPIGAAKGKQSDTEALCQLPAPPLNTHPRRVPSSHHPSLASWRRTYAKLYLHHAEQVRHSLGVGLLVLPDIRNPDLNDVPRVLHDGVADSLGGLRLCLVHALPLLRVVVPQVEDLLQKGLCVRLHQPRGVELGESFHQHDPPPLVGLAEGRGSQERAVEEVALGIHDLLPHLVSLRVVEGSPAPGMRGGLNTLHPMGSGGINNPTAHRQGALKTLEYPNCFCNHQ